MSGERIMTIETEQNEKRGSQGTVRLGISRARKSLTLKPLRHFGQRLFCGDVWGIINEYLMISKKEVFDMKKNFMRDIRIMSIFDAEDWGLPVRQKINTIKVLSNPPVLRRYY